MAHPRLGDTVKVQYTGRLSNGEIFAMSTDGQPLAVTLGDVRLFPGLEEALVRMEPGEERTIHIPSEQAYGPHRPELLMSLERSELPDTFRPAVGQQLKVQEREGDVRVVKVVEITEDELIIDVNHRLAGQNLIFDLKLLDVQSPTA